MNISNNSSASETTKPNDNYKEALLAPVAFTVGASILGSFANLWFVLVIIHVKSLRQKAIYRILLGVIMDDFLLDTFFFSFEGVQNLIFFKTGKLYAEWICIFEAACLNVVMNGSIVGQFFVAVNRGTAVFSPIYYRTVMTKRFVTITVLIACYLFPILFFFGLINWEILYPIDRNLGDCTYRFKTNISKEFVNVVFNYIPIFGSMIIYMAISVRIMMTSKAKRGEVMKRARGSFNMFMCMLVFGFCFISIPIARSLGIFGKNIPATMWFIIFARLSFTLNPLFYILFDSQLRRGSFQFLKIRILRKPAQSMGGDTSIQLE